MKGTGAVSAVIGLALVAALAPPGAAVVPGANGKIAFASDRDGNEEIYVMNADGSGQTRLTSSSAADFWPSWSPDGTKIAFASDRDGQTEIYVMNVDGSGQTRLTSNPADDQDPSWQPIRHARSLSLRVGRKARGTLTVDDGYSACAQGVPVKVQRREDGRWRLIGTDRTSDTGRYVVPGEFGPGRYRALARRVILPSGDVCLRAVSRTVRV